MLSAFFKSNRRNLRLLQGWQAGQREEVRRGTRLRCLVLALVFASLIALLLGLWLASAWLMSRLV